jgi:hypothetical protein
VLPPPRAFADADIVLPDATTFMAFAKTDNMADLMSYLGDRLRVTRDVLREIRRHVMETPDCGLSSHGWTRPTRSRSLR